MKKLVILLFALFLTVPVLGQWTPDFDIIASPAGPLDFGHEVHVTNGQRAHTGHSISDAWFRLYHENNFLIEIRIPNENKHFTIGPTYEIEGYADFYVGEYTWADELELVVATSFVTQQYHWMSTNSLPINPSTEVIPTTGIWGIILMLLLIPAIWLWKR